MTFCSSQIYYNMILKHYKDFFSKIIRIWYEFLWKIDKSEAIRETWRQRELHKNIILEVFPRNAHTNSISSKRYSIFNWCRKGKCKIILNNYSKYEACRLRLISIIYLRLFVSLTNLNLFENFLHTSVTLIQLTTKERT